MSWIPVMHFPIKRCPEKKGFIMKFLSLTAGRNIIDLSFLNNESSVVTIFLILFSKNMLFLTNSLFLNILEIAYSLKIAYFSKTADFFTIAYFSKVAITTM